MKTYFDSAVIAKLYVQESNGAEAIRLVSTDTAPYALTHWQDIEVRTALRLKLIRREATPNTIRRETSAAPWKRRNGVEYDAQRNESTGRTLHEVC